MNGTDAVDLRDQLTRLLDQLTPRQRAVIVLRYWEQLSEAETAAYVVSRSETALANVVAEDPVVFVDIPDSSGAVGLDGTNPAGAIQYNQTRQWFYGNDIRGQSLNAAGQPVYDVETAGTAETEM